KFRRCGKKPAMTVRYQRGIAGGIPVGNERDTRHQQTCRVAQTIRRAVLEWKDERHGSTPSEGGLASEQKFARFLLQLSEREGNSNAIISIRDRVFNACEPQQGKVYSIRM